MSYNTTSFFSDELMRKVFILRDCIENTQSIKANFPLMHISDLSNLKNELLLNEELNRFYQLDNIQLFNVNSQLNSVDKTKLFCPLGIFALCAAGKRNKCKGCQNFPKINIDVDQFLQEYPQEKQVMSKSVPASATPASAMLVKPETILDWASIPGDVDYDADESATNTLSVTTPITTSSSPKRPKQNRAQKREAKAARDAQGWSGGIVQKAFAKDQTVKTAEQVCKETAAPSKTVQAQQGKKQSSGKSEQSERSREIFNKKMLISGRVCYGCADLNNCPKIVHMCNKWECKNMKCEKVHLEDEHIVHRVIPSECTIKGCERWHITYQACNNSGNCPHYNCPYVHDE